MGIFKKIIKKRGTFEFLNFIILNSFFFQYFIIT